MFENMHRNAEGYILISARKKEFSEIDRDSSDFKDISPKNTGERRMTPSNLSKKIDNNVSGRKDIPKKNGRFVIANRELSKSTKKKNIDVPIYDIKKTHDDLEKDNNILKENDRLENCNNEDILESEKSYVVSNEDTSDDEKPSKRQKVKLNPYLVAKEILDVLEFKIIDNEIHYRDIVTYHWISEDQCKVLIRSVLGEETQMNLNYYTLNELVSSIKTNPFIQINSNEIKTRNSIFVFKNGLYDINSERFVEPKRNEIYLSCIDFEFDPESEEYGYEFEEYISFCTGNEQNLRKLIYEVIGYIMANSNEAKKFFILLGDSNTGKSTFGNLIEGLVGEEYCCHVALQNLSARFMTSELYQRKLCLNMDISSAALKDTSIVKQLTGNDKVFAERKGGHPFYFKNKCKLLYGCNSLPKVVTASDEKAFYDRMIILPFLNVVKNSKQNKKLVQTLLKERNYIIKKAMEAYRDLVKGNYKFTKCEISESIKNDYINRQNTIKTFIEECCIIESDSRVYISELYQRYKSFCIESGYLLSDIETLTTMSKELNKRPHIKSARWREGKDNLRGFIGIKLK